MVDLKNLAVNLPKTKKAYLFDSYLSTIESKILTSYCERNKHCYIVVNETIFHPQGGGQPTDIGFIAGKTFKLEVKKVLDVNGVVFHYGNLITDKNSEIFGEVSLQIDWGRRYRIMRAHTAGHILDFAVNQIIRSDVETISANHSHDISHIVYRLPPSTNLDIKELENISNNVVKACIPVKSTFMSKDEFRELMKKAPNIGRLPDIDEYRVVTIEGINAIPCSGTHVGDTCEIGRINVIEKKVTQDGIAIFYTIFP